MVIKIPSEQTGYIDQSAMAAEFDSILEMYPYIFVMVLAPWCGACKSISRELESIDVCDNYKTVAFVEINVDDYPTFAEEEGIVSLPVFIIYKYEKQVNRKDGAISSREICEFIDEVMV